MPNKKKKSTQLYAVIGLGRFGSALARTLAEKGEDVLVIDRDRDKINAAAEYIGAAGIVTADLTSADAADKLHAQTGGVDILILNASIQYKRQWDGFSAAEVDAQLDCNLKSTYYMMKTYAPYMKEKGWGRIVTIGSVNQYNNHPELLLYGATKAAQMKLVQGVAKSLAPFGITVNNIAPGAILTPRNDEALADKEFYDKVVASIPAGYVGDPKDMNGAALLLCSDEGKYITGSEIIADGGMHL